MWQLLFPLSKDVKLEKKTNQDAKLWHFLAICVVLIGSLSELLCILNATQKKIEYKRVLVRRRKSINGSRTVMDPR